MTTTELLTRAKAASVALAICPTETKNRALAAMADALTGAAPHILRANDEDVCAARSTLSEVMIDRLRLNEARLSAMADGIRALINLHDPVGEPLDEHVRADGLRIRRVRVPLGVVGIIYESRPNVTSDAAALCFKSGNACVLKCGKEAARTSRAIVDALRDALAPFALSDAVCILEDNTRRGAEELMHATGLLDALIPRGGAGLIRACVEGATVPCIETGTGICHIYVDREADLSVARSIVNNAKTSRPSVCNAAEVCLVHRAVADTFLPMLKQVLCDERQAQGLPPVELRTDAYAHAIIGGTAASEEDFDTEFLDYILAVRVVDGLSDAIDHIRRHSTHHSEAIVTRDRARAARFTDEVDSAAVYVNASTRFTDGGEFGLGCEIGISTQKLHARGPMGLCALTSYKYIIEGDGHIRT